jgi:elongation factor 1-gamma
VASQNNKANLLGKTAEEKAKVLQWASCKLNTLYCVQVLVLTKAPGVNSEYAPVQARWFLPFAGMAPYVKKDVDEAAAKTKTLLAILDKELSNKTFFVGERITLADIFAASLVQRGFATVSTFPSYSGEVWPDDFYHRLSTLPPVQLTPTSSVTSTP